MKHHTPNKTQKNLHLYFTRAPRITICELRELPNTYYSKNRIYHTLVTYPFLAREAQPVQPARGR
jgi:hypothetical protein